MPEWIGTVMFFVAIALTAAKLDNDFGDKGLLAYGMLIVMILIYAGAVGSAYI